MKNVEGTKKAPFAYWTVGGRDYTMKLGTANICQLEEKLRGNLLNVITTGNIPPLSTMLTIIHGAMQNWEHGITLNDVYDLFDRYCEEGGTQLSLMSEVLLPVYSVSGFFSENQKGIMDKKLDVVKSLL